MNTKEWQPAKTMRALVFGRYGTGKTWGALTFPRPNVLDFDRGIGVCRHPEFINKHGLRHFEFQQFKELKLGKGGIPSDHNVFDDACRYFDLWMSSAKRGEFDTWVVDSATSLSMHAMYKGVVLLGGKQMSVVSKTHSEAMQHGLLVPKIQDYAAERSMVEQFIAMVLDTDKHVIVICHEKELMDDGGTITARVPLLTGKSVDSVPLMFDEVWHTDTKPFGMDTKYILQTKPFGVMKAKSRYGMPDGIEWNYDTVKKHFDTLPALYVSSEAASSQPPAPGDFTPTAAAGGVK